jgi:hypothetical protein
MLEVVKDRVNSGRLDIFLMCYEDVQNKTKQITKEMDQAVFQKCSSKPPIFHLFDSMAEERKSKILCEGGEGVVDGSRKA